MATHEAVHFPGALGTRLAARLDQPSRPAIAYALFAHCFTCSKDTLAATRISAALTEHGFGVLRFDFTGLGHSEGEFANTNFSSNVGDLVAAADYLRAFPQESALVLSVELCSLTLQREDASMANVIASGLFGDGAAAVVLRGAATAARGPRVLATRSIFYPNTESVMGWEVGDSGFRVVLSADVPAIAGGLRPDVEKFLAEHGTSLAEIGVRASRPVTAYRAKGCAHCHQTGYLGRVGIFELMIVDDAIRAQITQSTDSKTIKKAAVEHGMQPLRVDGARKVIEGVTSIEEILRATEEEGVLAQI